MDPRFFRKYADLITEAEQEAEQEVADSPTSSPPGMISVGRVNKYNTTTFKQERRKLNVPLLIQRGAIFVTDPHGDNGWETDNQEAWAFSLITLMNVEQGDPWMKEAKQHLKPQSYKRAEQQINSSAPNLGSDELVYDGKYNQILWSIQKLGLGRQAFLK
jgi:hypothetical protein